jgi:hypothetical protein
MIPHLTHFLFSPMTGSTSFFLPIEIMVAPETPTCLWLSGLEIKQHWINHLKNRFFGGFFVSIPILCYFKNISNLFFLFYERLLKTFYPAIDHDKSGGFQVSAT